MGRTGTDANPAWGPVAADRPGRAGFTVVELSATLAIILLLVGLVVGMSSRVAARRAESQAQAEMAALGQSLEAFRREVGDYPWVGNNPLSGSAPQWQGGSELLRTLLGYRSVDPGRPELLRSRAYLDLNRLTMAGTYTDPNVEVDPVGSYAVDPWGQPYVYLYNQSFPMAESHWRNPGFILLSAGPDGTLSLPGSNVMQTGQVDRSAYDADPLNADNLVFKL